MPSIIRINTSCLRSVIFWSCKFSAPTPHSAWEDMCQRRLFDSNNSATSAALAEVRALLSAVLVLYALFPRTAIQELRNISPSCLTPSPSTKPKIPNFFRQAQIIHNTVISTHCSDSFSTLSFPRLLVNLLIQFLTLHFIMIFIFLFVCKLSNHLSINHLSITD